MSTKISSGLTLSSDFYLRSYYKFNTNATKTSYRKSYSDVELSYEDSRALERGSKKVSSFTFDDEQDNTASVINSVQAFCKTYNNAVSSANSDSNMKRYASQLKSLSSKYEDELSEIGITVEKDGSLTVNTSLLSIVDEDKIGEVFGSDSDFTTKAASISRRMNRSAYDEIYSGLTGSGTKINIVL